MQYQKGSVKIQNVNNKLTTVHKYGFDNVTLHSGKPTSVAEFGQSMNFNSCLRKMNGFYHFIKIIISHSWESNFIRSVVCSSQISSHQCTELGGN